MNAFTDLFLFVVLLSIVLHIIEYTEEAFGFKGNLALFIATGLFSYLSGVFNIYIFFLLTLSFFGVVGIKRPE